jgi:hypothetical protein
MRVFQQPARCHFERQREIFLNSRSRLEDKKNLSRYLAAAAKAEDVVYGVIPVEAINLVVRLSPLRVAGVHDEIASNRGRELGCNQRQRHGSDCTLPITT